MLKLFTFVLGLFNLVGRAYIITLMWLWFVIPTFPSAPVLSVLPTIGLLWLFHLCLIRESITAKKLHDSKEFPDEEGYVSLVNGFAILVVNAVTLLFGYVLHLFM